MIRRIARCRLVSNAAPTELLLASSVAASADDDLSMREWGERWDVLQVITHAPDAADVMSLYTTYPWSTLCAEVAKLQITLPERHTPRVVLTPGTATPGDEPDPPSC